MGGWIRHSLGQVAGKAHLLSPATSVLALLTLKLPGLIPFLSSSATPSVPSPFSTRLLQMAHRRSAAFWKAAAAVGVTGIMVSAAFAGMPTSGVHSAEAPQSGAPHSLSPSNLSIFEPYVVAPGEFSIPENVSLPGNFSHPVLATGTAGAQGVMFLLAAVNNLTNSSLVLFTGVYSADAALAALSCPEHPGHGSGKSCHQEGLHSRPPPVPCGPPGSQSHPEGSPPPSQNCTVETPTQPIVWAGPVYLASFL